MLLTGITPICQAVLLLRQLSNRENGQESNILIIRFYTEYLIALAHYKVAGVIRYSKLRKFVGSSLNQVGKGKLSLAQSEGDER